MARKKIEIDWAKFEELCSAQCTQAEIAETLGISVDTLTRGIKSKYKADFAEVFRLKRTPGLISLRRKMYETAMAGSIPMLIFLSKQLLGYTDKQEQTHAASKDSEKLIINFTRKSAEAEQS